MAKSPNVIVVVTDDQGYGDLSCYGNPVLQTPHLDALFAESVRLADYHVDPMCAPTRAALMTGRYAARTGVWSTLRGRFIMRRDEVTMGDVFKASGYRTGMFGKWHLGDNYPYRPQDRGFEDVLSFGGGVVGEIPDYWDNDNFTATYMRNGKPEQLTKYCTDLWFDEAIRFIEAHREEPFFCYLPTNAPHGPFDVHEKYSQPYLERGVEDQRTKFYGMIANIDENMGRLRQRLRGLDLEENTFLIFMGDNGTSAGCGLDRQGFLTNGFNGGMRGKKAWVYEGGHRNACFLFWPEGGIDGGRDIGSVTTHMDLLPTLIELCDLEAPAVHFDGDSLAPALTDPSFFWPDRTLFVQQQQVDQPVKYKDFAVMTDRWRLVRSERDGPAEDMLFDMLADLGQREDVASQHPEIVGSLLASYEYWWADISERFGEYCTIPVGSDQNEEAVKLTAHSWHGQEGIYNQCHVRPGVQDNGFWAIEVEREGIYEVVLRRWPEEADTPVRAGMPGRTGVLFVTDFVVGKAIPFVRAKLQIGEIEVETPVGEADCAVRFEISLAAGKTRLQTWLTDEEGQSSGAYYVYVKRMGD